MGAAAHTILVPSVAVRIVLPHPLQHLQLPGPSGVYASARVSRAVVLPRPLQHRQVPARSGPCRRRPIPRAVVLLRPLQYAQVAGQSGYSHVNSFHGQPRLCSHCSTSKRQPTAAAHAATASHGQHVLFSHRRRRRRTAHTPAAPTTFTAPALRRPRPPPSLRGDEVEGFGRGVPRVTRHEKRVASSSSVVACPPPVGRTTADTHQHAQLR